MVTPAKSANYDFRPNSFASKSLYPTQQEYKKCKKEMSYRHHRDVSRVDGMAV